jgi:formamidopyrimidine-DNA glycosylase
MRKLGGVWLAHDREEVGAILGPLGRDALGMPTRRFRELLSRRRGGAKAALMDQKVLAGVGNLIADEALWQARIHPRARVDQLSDDEVGRLAEALRKVLRQSVGVYDTLPPKRTWLLSVRGRPGAACPRCGTPLARTVAAGRTTFFCPTCQPELRAS